MTTDAQLIEQIARAMCKADGNEPDHKCTQHLPLHLKGLAKGYTYTPSENFGFPAWRLYTVAAEGAIAELRDTHVITVAEMPSPVHNHNLQENRTYGCLNLDHLRKEAMHPSEATQWLKESMSKRLDKHADPDFLSLNKAISCG